MPSEARQKKIMEKLNRAQKCSILGPQNLGSGGTGPPGPPPGSAPGLVDSTPYFLQEMAVYFDHKIQAPGQGGHSLSAWHSNFPILAVASSDTSGGSVNLYMEEVIHKSNFCRSKLKIKMEI